MNKKSITTKKDKKSSETVANRTEEMKKALISQLKKTPIVQLACERAGVSRATYYRWRKNDHIFAKAADRALRAGKSLINDLAESKLIKSIQADNLTAIIFWLKYNSHTYSKKRARPYEVESQDESIEEIIANSKDYVELLQGKKEGMNNIDIIMQRDKRYEKEDEIEEKMAKYDEDEKN